MSEATRGHSEAAHAPDDPVERGRRLVRMAVPFYLGMAALSLGWRGLVRGESILRAPAVEAARVWPASDAVWAGLLLGGGVVAFSAAWTTLLPSGRAVSEFLGQAVGRLTLAQTTMLALASGLGEEMLFRGALQPEFGLVVTSILFGLAHLVPRWPIALWSLYAVGIGLLFGWVFDATGSLWAPIVAHAVVNGVNLPILSRRYGDAPSRGDGMGNPEGREVESGARADVPRSAGFDDASDRVDLDEGAER